MARKLEAGAGRALGSNRSYLNRYQAVSTDGNVIYCAVTKRAAVRFVAKHTGLSVERARAGFCPVHRCEHQAEVRRG